MVQGQGFKPAFKATVTALEPNPFLNLRYLVVSAENFNAAGG